MRSHLSTDLLSKLTLALFTMGSLTACAKTPTFQSVPDSEKNNPSFATDAPPPKTLKNLPPEVKQKLNALIAKTKKNMIFVKGGTYDMGDFGPVHHPQNYSYTGDTDNPMHKVTVDSFSLNAYKASYADFDVYSAATGIPEFGRHASKSSRISRMPENAPAGINWSEGRHYCQWLGNQLGVPMDLPTEAQWEFAARNRGQYVIFATDNGKLDDGRNIWTKEQRDQFAKPYSEYGKIAVLGKFPPSPMGFYDMVTDNYEWMLDWYDANYYKVSPQYNPQGPKIGKEKSMRSYQVASGMDALGWGDGATVRRSERLPNKQPLDGDTEFNQHRSTSVRCAANHDKPII